MIVQLVPGIFMIIYADDLSIRMRLCGNIAVDEMTINRQMAAIQAWMDSNLLLFNDQKTEILVISKRNQNVYKELAYYEKRRRETKEGLQNARFTIYL